MDTPTPSIPHHGPDLFSKVGPLPAWAWGAVVVGGYIIYQHMNAGANPQVVDNLTEGGSALDPADVAAEGLPTIDPSTAGYNYQDVLSGEYQGTTTGSGTRYSTNQQWAISVISNLTAMGFSASLVTTAVAKYLAGQSLTAPESQVINAAITNFGPPPLPLPVTAAPVPPVTPPKPKPLATPHYYLVKPGDTVQSVSASYIKRGYPQVTVARLLQLNTSTAKDPRHRIYPGKPMRIN